MNIQSAEFLSDQELHHTLPPHGVSAQFFCAIYDAFGVELTDNLRHFTYGACDLSRIVDDCIDFPYRETPPTFDSLLEGLAGGTIENMSELEANRALLFAGSLNQDQFDYACTVYGEAVEVAKFRSSAPNIEDYASAVSKEAEVQSAALRISEDPDRPDIEGRKKYNKWLGHFVLGAYYVDSAIDLARDFEEGRTLVKPGPGPRLTLLAKAIPELKITFRDMPARTIPSLAALLVNYQVPALKRRFN